MSNKLLIAPPAAHPATHTSSADFSAPSAPGVYDTLRSALNPTNAFASLSQQQLQPQLHLQSSHPLESRLVQWEATQTSLKHSLMRRQFGLAAPLQREMELMTIRHGDEVRPAMLGGGRSVHEDILLGRDWELGWEDVFTGNEMMPIADFHSEMEYRMGMNW